MGPEVLPGAAADRYSLPLQFPCYIILGNHVGSHLHTLPVSLAPHHKKPQFGMKELPGYSFIPPSMRCPIIQVNESPRYLIFDRNRGKAR